MIQTVYLFSCHSMDMDEIRRQLSPYASDGIMPRWKSLMPGSKVFPLAEHPEKKTDADLVHNLLMSSARIPDAYVTPDGCWVSSEIEQFRISYSSYIRSLRNDPDYMLIYATCVTIDA